MTPATLTFTCSICGEPSTDICLYCTKDACANHICEKCHRCSDCCECEIRLQEPVEPAAAPAVPQTVVVAEDIVMVEEEKPAEEGPAAMEPAVAPVPEPEPEKTAEEPTPGA